MKTDTFRSFSSGFGYCLHPPAEESFLPPLLEMNLLLCTFIFLRHKCSCKRREHSILNENWCAVVVAGSCYSPEKFINSSLSFKTCLQNQEAENTYYGM